MNDEKVTCPECGADMVLRSTTKYTYRDGTPRKFWGCTRWPLCTGVHTAHPNGKPLGIPANKETKQWRIRAHAKFDRLWQEWGYSRKDAYSLLQTIMGLDSKEGHISRFNIDQCKQLIHLLEKIGYEGGEEHGR